MGRKEDRRRDQRRRLFVRYGWQDDRGDWFVMCAKGCGTVLGWAEAGARQIDKTGDRADENMELICNAGCNPHRAAAVRRAWKKQVVHQKIDAMLALATVAAHPDKTVIISSHPPQETRP